MSDGQILQVFGPFEDIGADGMTGETGGDGGEECGAGHLCRGTMLQLAT